MKLIEDLKNMKFTEAEAKVYKTLLKYGSSTGYEVSKYSGVARSKIYNHLEELSQRGVVELSSDGKSNYYRAIEPDELIELTKKNMKDTLESFEYLAKNIHKPEENTGIWEMENYNRLLTKTKETITNAKESLYIQIWIDELDSELTSLINKKIDELSKTVIILYDKEGTYNTSLKKFFPHGFEMERLEDMTHRWINIVADENTLLYSAILFNKEVSGIYTENKILSFFSKEYIQHDAYCLKLIDKFHDQLVDDYGQAMSEIRNIYD